MPNYPANTMHTYLHRMHKRQNWYTPSIGTIGMAMAHRFARHATNGPSLWTIENIALTFGIGNSATRVWRNLDRLDRFGIINRTGDRIAVRLWLAPLTQRQIAQLPPYLAAAYPHQPRR